MVKGMLLQDAAEQLTSSVPDPFKREKQIRAIRRDWNRSDSWMPEIVRLNRGTVLAELVAGANEAMKFCWIEYAKADNSNAKIGALRTIIVGKTRVALVLMRAGFIEQATQHVDTTMTIAGTPFDVDPELRKALVVEAERQAEEKIIAESGASSSGQE